MIKSMCSERFIEVDGDDHNAALTIHGVSDASSVFLNYQGVTALIKELEEVREKLPKPKRKKSLWIVLSKYGDHKVCHFEDAANRELKDWPGGKIKQITWEVTDE